MKQKDSLFLCQTFKLQWCGSCISAVGKKNLQYLIPLQLSKFGARVYQKVREGSATFVYEDLLNCYYATFYYIIIIVYCKPARAGVEMNVHWCCTIEDHIL